MASPTSHLMKVSSNGQVSIPAEVRARWQTELVIVVDFGDRVVVRPIPDDAVASLRGKYRGRGPSTDQIRKATRAEDAARELRRDP